MLVCGNREYAPDHALSCRELSTALRQVLCTQPAGQRDQQAAPEAKPTKEVQTTLTCSESQSGNRSTVNRTMAVAAGSKGRITITMQNCTAQSTVGMPMPMEGLHAPGRFQALCSMPCAPRPTLPRRCLLATLGSAVAPLC